MADVVQKVVNCYCKGEVIVRGEVDLLEASLLMLNIEKAQDVRCWVPTYTGNDAIRETVTCYKKYYLGEICWTSR